MTADSSEGVRFARRVFGVAGIYGLLILLPQYFLETSLFQRPPIRHPEHFYGFLGVAVAWQVAFLLIARDPVRLRPVMLAGLLEKFSFGTAVGVLYVRGRVAAPTLAFAVIDAMLGVLFITSYLRTRDRRLIGREADSRSDSGSSETGT